MKIIDLITTEELKYIVYIFNKQAHLSIYLSKS